jgi:hypothetical protein
MYVYMYVCVCVCVCVCVSVCVYTVISNFKNDCVLLRRDLHVVRSAGAIPVFKNLFLASSSGNPCIKLLISLSFAQSCLNSSFLSTRIRLTKSGVTIFSFDAADSKSCVVCSFTRAFWDRFT